jgi:hypothetical protein
MSAVTQITARAPTFDYGAPTGSSHERVRGWSRRVRSATIISITVPSAIMAGMVLVIGVIVPAAPLPVIPFGRAAAAPFVDVGTCFEASMIPFAAPGMSGRAILCDDGQDLRVTLQVSGLTPGEEYTAWFGYDMIPPVCREASCRLIDTQGDDPTAAMQRLGDASVQPSGVLELERELADVRLLHGARIGLQVLGERGRAGPYAQAIFTVP